MDTDRPGDVGGAARVVGIRGAVERRSAAPLVLLSQQPRWLLGLAVAGLLAAVVFAPAVAAVPCLLLLLGVLLWLSYLSWPLTPPAARAVRVLALSVLLLVAVQRVVG